MPDWKNIEREYITGTKPAQLIKKYKLKQSTFYAQLTKGKWTDKKKKSNRKIIEKLENKTVSKIDYARNRFYNSGIKQLEKLEKEFDKANRPYEMSMLSKAIKDARDTVWKSLGIPDKIEHTQEKPFEVIFKQKK